MEIEEMKKRFNELLSLNVNEKTEKKKQGNTELTYLSWAYAWAEFKKVYPDADYTIKKFTNAVTGVTLPYLESELGFLVFTEITAGGLTHEMWLPVMDGANKAMLKEPYTYATKYNGEKTVDKATMFDINKTIMRCLVKNMAMFGLGLYIYAGEDLPPAETCTAEQVAKMRELEVIEPNLCKKFNVTSIEHLTAEQADFVIQSKLKSRGE